MEEKEIKELIDSLKGLEISTEKIQQTCCDVFDITLEQMLSKKRSRHLTEPRQLAQFIIRDLYFVTWQKIGKLFNRDHSTVMHSYGTIQLLLSYDRMLIKKFKEIINILQNEG